MEFKKKTELKLPYNLLLWHLFSIYFLRATILCLSLVLLNISLLKNNNFLENLFSVQLKSWLNFKLHTQTCYSSWCIFLQWSMPPTKSNFLNYVSFKPPFCLMVVTIYFILGRFGQSRVFLDSFGFSQSSYHILSHYLSFRYSSLHSAKGLGQRG